MGGASILASGCGESTGRSISAGARGTCHRLQPTTDDLQETTRRHALLMEGGSTCAPVSGNPSSIQPETPGRGIVAYASDVGPAGPIVRVPRSLTSVASTDAVWAPARVHFSRMRNVVGVLGSPIVPFLMTARVFQHVLAGNDTGRRRSRRCR